MLLKRPGTGSANPSAHSDPVLAKRHITRNVNITQFVSMVCLFTLVRADPLR